MPGWKENHEQPIPNRPLMSPSKGQKRRVSYIINCPSDVE